MIKPQPIPQTYWDENRSMYDAETTITDKLPVKCKHYLVRENAISVKCENCNAGWIDHGQWKLENGKISGLI